jgi:hypothetical protein
MKLYSWIWQLGMTQLCYEVSQLLKRWNHKQQHLEQPLQPWDSPLYPLAIVAKQVTFLTPKIYFSLQVLIHWNLVLSPLLLHTTRLQIKRYQCCMSCLSRTTHFGFVSKYHANTYTKTQHNKAWRNKTQGVNNRKQTNKVGLLQILYKWYTITNIIKIETTKHKEKTIEKKEKTCETLQKKRVGTKCNMNVIGSMN